MEAVFGYERALGFAVALLMMFAYLIDAENAAFLRKTHIFKSMYSASLIRKKHNRRVTTLHGHTISTGAQRCFSPVRGIPSVDRCWLPPAGRNRNRAGR